MSELPPSDPTRPAVAGINGHDLGAGALRHPPRPAATSGTSRRRPLDRLLAPESVAVIGATDDPRSLGRTVLLNLVNGRYPGLVWAVGTRPGTVIGLKIHGDLAALPQPPDLVVIATPARETPQAVAACAAAGVEAVVIVSSGFAESGAAGAEIERRILAIARPAGMRVLGPNALGVINPRHGLNASFGPAIPPAGGIAFLAQSGALGSAVLDQGRRARIGFSAFVSLGTMLDVGWGDLIDWFGSDPHTTAIVIAMESLGDARAFLAATREVALTKPVVVLKSGRSGAGRAAAIIRPGGVAEHDDAIDAAFDRAGVLRVDTLAQLFAMADVLAKQPRPRGPRLAIVGNAGGPGVMAADAAVAAGAAIATLGSESIAILDRALPEHWSRANPVDLLGEAGPDAYAHALETVAADDGCDGVLVLLTPQHMTDPLRIAEAVARVAPVIRKPLIACWMGGTRVRSGRDLLMQAGIPAFLFPEEAAVAFALSWRHGENQRRLHETPALADAGEADAPDEAAAAAIIYAARAAGRTALGEHETKALLAAWRIPVIETRTATTAAGAVAHADAIGYPVALKVRSDAIVHKAEAGGVALWLRGAAEVSDAYARIHAAAVRRFGAGAFAGVVVERMVEGHLAEALIGAVRDRDLGPIIAFGSGGGWPDIAADRAVALPPLTTVLARSLVERTRLGRALVASVGLGQRELDQLDRLLVRFSRLVIRHPWLAELELNPVMLASGQVVVADARAALDPAGTDPASIPRPAIRPYPSEHVSDWTSADGANARIRPIRPEDEPAMRTFHAGLGEHEVMLRWFQPFALGQRVAHDRLVRVCFGDYARELALVVETTDGRGDRAIVAVGRASRARFGAEAEMAVVAHESWRRRGVVDRLVRALVDAARREGLARLTARIMPFDLSLQQICRDHGFTVDTSPERAFATAVLDLTTPAVAATAAEGRP